MPTGKVGLKWGFGDGQAGPCMGRCMGGAWCGAWGGGAWGGGAWVWCMGLVHGIGEVGLGGWELSGW